MVKKRKQSSLLNALEFLKNNIILIYIKPHLKSILNNERRYNYENNSGEAINSRCIQTVRNILVCSRWRRIWIGRRIFTFYPDRIAVSSEKRIGFSTLKVSKPEKYIVEELEYHKTTWEMFMPLNDDAVLHVAPKSGGDVVTELTEAFIVPKGTMVKLDAAVWHLAAMPVNVEELQSLIVLPEGTYMNDCTKVALNDEQKFEIVI